MQDTPGPLISIIVPVYQVAALAAAAIESLRAQTLTDFEALVIDDGSTDGSAEAAEAAFAGDPRFRLIRQPNRGLSAARNAGLDAARGAFIGFLDGDDTLAPAFLETLHAAILREGTDWAACAITLVYPDGNEHPHPALHATTDPGPPRCLALHDAREVVRIFPSAWNKLYRRALFDDLRFPEGIWFEDHEVFWALAARAPALAYVPEPLYRHRRGRAGQITGADDDRVFDQLRVLDRLHPRLMRMAQGTQAYAMLATRLVHERALVLHDPARRARFLTATFALFDRLGVRWTPDWDPEISRALGRVLAGGLPLSVVVLDPRPAAALAALAAQGMADMEVLVLGSARAPDTLPGGVTVKRIAPGVLTPAGVAEATRGHWLLVLAPGEVPLPEGVMRLVNLAESHGAPLAQAAFERPQGGYHDGWTDNRLPGQALADLPLEGGPLPLPPEAALRLYPALGNRLFRRDLLTGMGAEPVIGGTPAAVQALVLASALEAGAVACTRLPVARVPDRPAGLPGLWGARDAALVMAVDSPHLPRGWRGTVFFRLLRLRRAGGVLRWLAALLLARAEGWLPADPAAWPDPECPGWLRRLARRGRPR